MKDRARDGCVRRKVGDMCEIWVGLGMQILGLAMRTTIAVRVIGLRMNGRMIRVRRLGVEGYCCRKIVTPSFKTPCYRLSLVECYP